MTEIPEKPGVVDLDGVILADLDAAYSLLEREHQRAFLGDVDNWHPTGALPPITDIPAAARPAIPDLDSWLRELVDGLPRRIRQYELRCHPDVFQALRDAAPAPEWSPGATMAVGVPGAYGSAAVVVKPEFGPGEWELYEDGEKLKAGRLGLGEIWEKSSRPERPAPGSDGVILKAPFPIT